MGRGGQPRHTPPRGGWVSLLWNGGSVSRGQVGQFAVERWFSLRGICNLVVLGSVVLVLSSGILVIDGISFRDEDRVKALHDWALQEVFNEKFDKSLSYCRQAIADFPDNIDIYPVMGKAYVGLKKYKEAEEAYSKFLEKYPFDQESLEDLGSLYVSLGRYSDAVVLYRRGVAGSKKRGFLAEGISRSFHVRLGDAYLRLNKLSEARSEFLAGESFSGALEGLVNVSIREGKIDEAVNLYWENFKKHPNSVDLVLDAGKIYEERGEFRQAKEFYERAIPVSTWRTAEITEALKKISGHLPQ